MRNPSPKKWYSNLPRVLYDFVAEEVRRGTLCRTLALSLKHGTLRFAEFATMDSLLRQRAEGDHGRVFLRFDGKAFTFGEIDAMTGKFASFLDRMGYVAGDGLAIMMENGPEFIAVYLATQRMGLYAVPVNTALIGAGLSHVVKDSRVRGIVIDEKFLPALKAADKNHAGQRDIMVHRESRTRGKRFSRGYKDLGEAWRGEVSDRERPLPPPDAVSTVLYTSGTTGKPKGVVYKYGSDWLRKAGLLNRLIHDDDDVLYTCLPLFHANALFLTLSASLWLGLPVVLSRRFSAGRFWDEANRHGATVFNAVGSMIPILLKNRPAPSDRENAVRLVLSAACPADCWRAFEERFGVTIWEGYSAVDGGQNFIFNFGNAPVGSLGKMSFSKFRVVDGDGRDAAPFKPGELVFRTGRKSGAVEYFRDDQATREKTRGGYVHTGDVVYRDDGGYLYFVGRNTDSMRRRGENVSAYEVESAALKHEAVLECAAYGVPSKLGEQDIMCAVVPVAGRKLDPASFVKWMGTRLARHAVPRYVRIVDHLPKTPTHRVIKSPLVEAGVTPDAFDAERRRSGGTAK